MWDGEHLEPGTLIEGKFEVRRVLGSGAMGSVIEATHVLLRAPVALKFMSPRMANIPGVVERFLNEGIAASRIDNDHVVKVLDVSRLGNGQPYLVMEYLEGEDLAAVLEREGQQGLEDVGRAVYFVLQILRGLQVAHQAGIIHRDLKPANCFVVTKNGEPDFVKIVDFGISKVQETGAEMNLTQEGSTMGTPLYVSLEQARDAARVDARSDLYSVAVILYELLSGRTPFVPRSLADLFLQLATATPQSLDELRDLPPGLAAVVQKGLAREPENRFQSAAEMASALTPFADERSEVVLRHLLSRPSLRSRPASLVPTRRSLSGPAPSLVNPSHENPAGSHTAEPDASSSLLAVSKSDVAAGRSVAPAAPERPLLSRKLVLAAAGLAVVGVVVIVVAASLGSDSEANRDATAAAAETASAPAGTPSALGASVSPTEPLPLPSASAVTASSSGVSLAPSAALTAAAPAASNVKPAPLKTPRKPSLKTIGIQD